MRRLTKQERLARARGRNRLTKHHILPQSRLGKEERSNILLLKAAKHWSWHTIFGLKSLEEVIMLLIRVHRAKKRCRWPCLLCRITKE